MGTNGSCDLNYFISTKEVLQIFDKIKVLGNNFAPALINDRL